MTESDKAKCKWCMKMQMKVVTREGGKRKVLDEHGHQWNGRICPSCNRFRVRTAMKALRTVRSSTPVSSQLNHGPNTNLQD
jgi:hypothetical protein